MTINMKKFVIMCLFLTTGLTLTAQNKNWTLQECVAYAIENNISVKQSELEIENSDISKSDAIGNYLPSLNGSAGNSWNTGLTQDVTTGVLIVSLAVSVRVITSPSFATDVIALFVAMLTELRVGAVPSYVQLNCEAAELLLPTASVNAPLATSIVVAPDAVGVNVAV